MSSGEISVCDHCGVEFFDALDLGRGHSAEDCRDALGTQLDEITVDFETEIAQSKIMTRALTGALVGTFVALALPKLADAIGSMAKQSLVSLASSAVDPNAAESHA